MRTSARNQFTGKVTDVRHGAVNDEIQLEIAGGQTIVAVVTHRSAENLGLQVGTEAFALIKASSVIVMVDADESRMSARNCLTGVVTRLEPGAVNSEVVLELPGGSSVAAIVTLESAKHLGLEVGKPASALFKASSVILGVSD